MKKKKMIKKRERKRKKKYKKSLPQATKESKTIATIHNSIAN